MVLEIKTITKFICRISWLVGITYLKSLQVSNSFLFSLIWSFMNFVARKKRWNEVDIYKFSIPTCASFMAKTGMCWTTHSLKITNRHPHDKQMKILIKNEGLLNMILISLIASMTYQIEISKNFHIILNHRVLKSR